MKLSLHQVTVAYPVNISARQQSIFATAAKAMSFGSFAKSGSNQTYVLALNQVTIDVKEGARIGLIGRNGSGKSTLLRTMAGIITPRSGKRFINGSVGCVLNLGSGLEADKSGIENMKMIARFYGMEGAELKNAVEDAANFSELGPYLDFPVRTYSSGMTARLCFGIATARHADIMLIDEVIGTGDAHFVAKAVARIKDICAKSGTVIIASHAESVLHDFCTQGVWMDSGTIKKMDELDTVLHAYNAAAG
ncbi:MULTISPECIES: ABC transporter ATP-binding protein [Asticcacaulis]|uniref:ABC transporter ATP-binding protein n=1 Tax=Asticcacaulis TaxID=76890 RepID=UPI001AE7DD4A|nr:MULTISPECIES: ATP-binding cassette domain-containing protein [Asticcacaulis]MBP2161876.1 ABC-2 type transport system ATP-binding protein/lipopolysaccharide transport system ATP-binding protein [Asticcacaulis solisilvae]MDR6802922.1 ABC-2 type transport system ATP-binding protein/lipopolysaccharide transport system ATP-binding protein [Asticcacaulis sp. BE141]